MVVRDFSNVQIRQSTKKEEEEEEKEELEKEEEEEEEKVSHLETCSCV